MPHGKPREGFEKVWGTVPTAVYEALLELMRRDGHPNLHQACRAALEQWYDVTVRAVQNPSSAEPRPERAGASSGVQNPSATPSEET